MEKAPSNKTPTPSTSINMDIWVVGTPNQLTETKFSKHKIVTAKAPFSVIGPFCNHHLFALTLASDRVVLHGNNVFSISVLLSKKPCSSFLKKKLIKSVSQLKY